MRITVFATADDFADSHEKPDFCFRSLAKPLAERMGLGATRIALMVGAYLVLNHATHIGGIKICDRPLRIQLRHFASTWQTWNY